MRRTAQALLILSLLLLAACGSSGRAGQAPPLVFPTQALGPSGPPPLSLYYGANATGGSPQYTIGALDAISGQQRWSYSAKAEVSEPLLNQGTVYFGALDHKVYALDAGSSRVRWSVSLGGFPQVETVDSGILYVIIAQGLSTQFNGGTLYALDASTGSMKWHTTTPGAFIALEDGVVYLAPTGQNLLEALNASDGSMQWQFQPQNPVQQAQIVNGQVYLTSAIPNTQNGVASLYVLDARTGAQQWVYPADGSTLPFSFWGVDNGLAYLTASDPQNSFSEYRLIALDAKAGSERWHYQTSSFYTYFDSAKVDSGVVYLGGNNGALYAVNDKTGALLWQTKPANTFTFIQQVSDGVIYMVANTEGLLAIRAKDGSVVWKYPAPTSGGIGIFAITNGLLIGESFSTAFQSSAHNYAFALNLSSGQAIWSYDAGGTALFGMVG